MFDGGIKLKKESSYQQIVNSFNRILDKVNRLTAIENDPEERSKQMEVAQSLLPLISEVIRYNPSLNEQTVLLIENFLKQQFRIKNTALMIKKLQKHNFIGANPMVKMSALQIQMLTTNTSRIVILEFLFSLISFESHQIQKQLDLLKQLAGYLGVSKIESEKLLKFARQTHSPFAFLGVNEQSSEEEIRKAFRKKILETHPDKNTHLESKEAEAEFMKVQFAWKKICEIRGF